jgi:Flp pilus assembly protein TadG
MKSYLHNLRRAEGAEIAEVAVVLPVVFMFLIGIIWFGRAFNIYSTIQQAAQQGALAAARPYPATTGGVPSIPTVTGVVESVMKASNVDPSQIISDPLSSPLLCATPYPAGKCTTAADKVTVCRNVQLNPPASTSPPVCGTVVTFKYPFSFSLPFTSLNWTKIYMTAQAQSRMEN